MAVVTPHHTQQTSLLSRDVSVGLVTLGHKVVLARNLSVMLRAGLPILDALDIVRDSATGRLKRILSRVRASIESGGDLSSALAQFPNVFSSLFTNTVAVGEKSGTLPERLSDVADQLEKDYQLLAKVRGAMLYPLVVLSATFVLGMVLSFVVLPKITPLFEGLQIELPFTTRALIWFSRFIQDHTVWLLVALFATVALVFWLVRRAFFKPVTHGFLLIVPILGRVVHNTNRARSCLTLGTLLKSGLNIDEALTITGETVGNFYYRRALQRVAQKIRRGSKVSENLRLTPRLFPSMMTRMIQVGEESGKLDETLLYLAGYYEGEVDTATKSLSTAIEPILLVVIGIVVGFLALSIITPIYDVTGGIKR